MNSETILNLTESQSYLYDRIKFSKYVNNPYSELKLGQICAGTSNQLSSSMNDYLKWEAIYRNCVYVDGNLEITNFHPYFNESFDDFSSNDEYHTNDENLDLKYDFSFFDEIREITGYLLIHGNRIKSLRFKNLKLIRGKTLFNGKYSVYIDSNVRLERLEMSSLREIQTGNIFIKNNPKLCHMDEINWKELLSDSNYYNQNSLLIESNANPLTCPKCRSGCCPNEKNHDMTDDEFSISNITNKCGCWHIDGCQNMTKLICDKRCRGRCFGPGPYDCCNEQCSAGCTGPEKNECIACKNFRIAKTGECVASCPRLQIADPTSHDLKPNPDGMYQYGITCVKTCPGNKFIHLEFCMNKCPNQTYEDEEYINNPDTGEKGLRRVCRPCTPEKCTKTCSIEKIDIKKKGDIQTENDLKNLENCEVLNSDLLILHPNDDKDNSTNDLELSENDLEVLSSLKVINGYVRIQVNNIKSLNFLRNLETIRANNLLLSKYSIIIISKSLKTLNLNKLKTIEKGDVYLKTESLCLFDTINWNSILNKKNSFNINKQNIEYAKKNCDNFVCDQSCNGCWSTEPNSCQFCKTYKLENRCVETCDPNTIVNNKYLYLKNNLTRECNYCHSECRKGCDGDTDMDCFECKNFKLLLNENRFKCVNTCPSTHYNDSSNKLCLPCHPSCYGCTGPGKKIEPNGCTKCNSALVDSDPAFTVLECILMEEYECSNGHFDDQVPLHLKSHPLTGKKVCRKCNEKCDNCTKSGDIFIEGDESKSQCKKCKYFLSKSTNRCVFNCTTQNEYIEPDSRNCLPCNIECKSGCSGPGSHQCNECRANKIYLTDVEKILNEKLAELEKRISYQSLTNLNYSSISQFSIETEIKRRKLKELKNLNNHMDHSFVINQMIEAYLKYIDNMKSDAADRKNTESISFCISDCPYEMPYKNNNNFCSYDQNNNTGLVITFTIITLIILISSLLLSYITFSIKDRKKRIEFEKEKMFFDLDVDENSNEDCDKLKLDLLSRDQLLLGNELGKGAFGTVYEGYYIREGHPLHDKIKVAIKVLNNLKIDDAQAAKKLNDEFFNEAKLLAKVDHKYCMQLRGLCIADPIMMVTQLMRYGSVISFLQKNRYKVNERMLLIWSQQIAEGMEYLESRKIVHRDLAARNILVKELYHIKIADFGLARVIQSNEHCFKAMTSTLLPIKWLAIESIRERSFTHQSDVWSYGVCLWEIFTLCQFKPYAEVTEPIELLPKLVKGVRLAQPQMANLDTYLVLLKCWLENPLSRPTFKELNEEFNKMTRHPKAYLDLQNVDMSRDFITISKDSQELFKKFENDAQESNIFYDDLNDDEITNKSNNTDTASGNSGTGSGSGAGSLIASCTNYNKDVEEKISKSCIKKKKKKYKLSSNTMPDEGIDLNSFELASSVGDTSNVFTSNAFTTSHRYSSISNQIKNSHDNNPIKDSTKVITFKRTSQANANNKPYESGVEEENDNKNYLINETKLKKQNSNIKNIKKLFNFKRAPKRIESQLSTATTATYLSSVYSSPGDKSPNNIDILNNLENEQQNFNSLFLAPLLKPSRSNSNSSASTFSANLNLNNSFDSNKINHLSNNNNSNSDYLEPVTYNVKQNMEYLCDTSTKLIRTPPIVINSNNSNQNNNIKSFKNNYYNEDISLYFDQTKKSKNFK